MFKTCSRCGKIHAAGYVCNAGRTYDNKYKTRNANLRNTAAWANKSREIKEQAFWLCEVCADEGALNYRALETHHIQKVEDFPELLLDDSNLVCLCIRHHRMADRGQIDQAYLQRLAQKRIEGYPPGGQGAKNLQRE